MEFKQLLPIVLMLILIGMLLGVGVIVLDNLSAASKSSITVVNESVTLTSATGTLANGYVTSITFIGNTTFRCDLPNADCLNITDSVAGTIATNGSFKDGPFNVSYAYKQATASSTAVDNSVTALSTISSTWLGLIITVVVLSIILAMVIGSFGMGQKR